MQRTYDGRGVFRLRDPRTGRVLASGSNTWSYGWGDAAARLFATGDATRRASYMYVVFGNVAAPGNTVTPPTLPRSTGLAYYQGLSSDPTLDYLRVPLVGVPALDVDPNSAGAASLAAGQVNRLTATALAAGAAGANGKPFGNASNSTICGVALVSAPAPASPGLDVVDFFGFFATGQQVLVPASGVVSVEYAVTFS